MSACLNDERQRCVSPRTNPCAAAMCTQTGCQLCVEGRLLNAPVCLCAEGRVLSALMSMCAFLASQVAASLSAEGILLAVNTSANSDKKGTRLVKCVPVPLLPCAYAGLRRSPRHTLSLCCVHVDMFVCLFRSFCYYYFYFLEGVIFPARGSNYFGQPCVLAPQCLVPP